MIEARVRHTILDLAVEDSYALSEIVSRVQQDCNEISEGYARDLARRCVELMLDEGLIEVTRLETPSGPESVVDSREARIALADDLAWRPAKHWRAHIRIVATPSGRTRYCSDR
jgi:hypothetical protein